MVCRWAGKESGSWKCHTDAGHGEGRETRAHGMDSWEHVLGFGCHKMLQETHDVRVQNRFSNACEHTLLLLFLRVS